MESSHWLGISKQNSTFYVAGVREDIMKPVVGEPSELGLIDRG